MSRGNQFETSYDDVMSESNAARDASTRVGRWVGRDVWDEADVPSREELGE